MENLIRFSQKESKSTEAALQMWRMESSFRLDEARFIGVGNPENIYNCTRFVKGSSKLWISSKYCAHLPPILEIWVHCCLDVSSYNSSKIIMPPKLSDTAKKKEWCWKEKPKAPEATVGFLWTQTTFRRLCSDIAAQYIYPHMGPKDPFNFTKKTKGSVLAIFFFVVTYVYHPTNFISHKIRQPTEPTFTAGGGAAVRICKAGLKP